MKIRYLKYITLLLLLFAIGGAVGWVASELTKTK